ncbi:phage tail tape measure protein [Primorskyibacter sp. S187A]|uniref:phage tail tape measure protein n=1 Tax=Primorskyibacter sp. S187A TaxID=3415130 RepID=UPI003C7B6830
MADLDGIEEFDNDVAALSQSLGQASALAAGFDGEMQRIHQTFSATGNQAAALDRTLTGGVKKAIDGLILNGDSLSSALDSIGQSMINAAYNAAVKPVSSHIGGLLSNVFDGLMPFADGGALSQGRVMPFAKGGVVSSPVTFPMRGATGLMGEAGPEAIMPLTRGPDGSLGVRAQGSGGAGVNVVMNISTPDVQGFQRSQSQIAAQMHRVLGRGARNR